jgi:hypothetical protein
MVLGIVQTLEENEVEVWLRGSTTMALHENSKILSVSVGCLLLLVEKHIMIQELIPKFKE